MSSKLWSRIVCICQCPLSVRIRREYATEDVVVSKLVSRPERVLSDNLQMLSIAKDMRIIGLLPCCIVECITIHSYTLYMRMKSFHHSEDFDDA